MIFTGKNKENFEKWFLMSKIRNQFTNLFKIETGLQFRSFCLLPFEMQQGVYLDYLDSVGLSIEVMNESGLIDKPKKVNFSWAINDGLYSESVNYPTRQEALTEAFKKADELINTLEK